MRRTADPLQVALSSEVAQKTKQGLIAPGMTCNMQRGKPRLRYRSGGTVQTAVLSMDWNLSNMPAITQFMEDASRQIFQGYTFKQSTTSTEKNLTSVGGFNWKEVYQKFGIEQEWSIRTSSYHDKWFKDMLALLADENNPVTDGRSLLQQYKRVHCPETKHYTQGRRALSFYNNLIDYAIEQHGLDPVWEVSDKFRLSLLKVSKTQQREISKQALTPPVESPDFLELLDALEHSNPDLYTMVALMGHYGLMGSELSVIAMTEHGLATVKAHKDHALPKHRKPRHIEAIDCLERQGLGERVAREWASGRRQLPNAVRNNIAKMFDAPHSYKNPNYKAVGDAARQLLDRCPAWQQLAKEKSLTPYSFRHSYAWRCHTEYNMEASRVAPWMGHRVDTHNDHYAEWFSQADQIKYKERMVAEAQHRASLTSQSNGAMTHEESD